MKRVLFFTFFLVTFLNVKGQDVPYSPMAVEGAHWFYFGETSQGLPFYDYGYSLSIKGDSIYNNQKYKKIYQYYFAFDNVKKTFPYPFIIKGGTFYGLIRDDTLQRKVFYIGKTFHSGCNDLFPNEFLLHDFSNINVNDTLKTCSFNGFAKAIVTGTENKVIYDRNRFIFTYKIPFMSASKVGEGIGFLINGGIFHIFPFEPQLWFTRYCLGTDEECNLTIVKSKDVSLNEHSKLHLQINDIIHDFLIYKKESSLKDDFDIIIYDINGQIVKKKEIDDLEQIIRLDLEQNSFYIATLVQHGSIIGTTKIYCNP